MQHNIVQRFLRRESTGGILLFFMAVMALILSNSSLSDVYQKMFYAPLDVHLANFTIDKPLLFWINDGLMAIFFLLVGLELKRELIDGELSKPSQIISPLIAALGGMIVPALIYIFINRNNASALEGWAVPVATDIAFALGVLSLFGKRVPLGLKLFLMALAIFDDVGAILIIAIFHTNSLSYFSLLMAVLLLVLLFCFNRFGVRRLTPYLLVGLVLWVCVLGSGVHATLAGVLLAFMIPMRKLRFLEEELHPWVAFFVMPLFAFANAGLSFAGLSFNILIDAVTLGVIFGLVIGKPVGVLGFTWVVTRFKWVNLPEDTCWLEMLGVALLCGIGFTMSLFLGTLAFQGNDVFMTEVRLGVLTGSVLSGVLGSVVLRFALQKRNLKLE